MTGHRFVLKRLAVTALATLTAVAMTGALAGAAGTAAQECASRKIKAAAANAANRNAILKSVDLFDTPWTPCR